MTPVQQHFFTEPYPTIPLTIQNSPVSSPCPATRQPHESACGALSATWGPCVATFDEIKDISNHHELDLIDQALEILTDALASAGRNLPIRQMICEDEEHFKDPSTFKEFLLDATQAILADENHALLAYQRICLKWVHKATGLPATSEETGPQLHHLTPCDMLRQAFVPLGYEDQFAQLLSPEGLVKLQNDTSLCMIPIRKTPCMWAYHQPQPTTKHPPSATAGATTPSATLVQLLDALGMHNPLGPPPSKYLRITYSPNHAAQLRFPTLCEGETRQSWRPSGWTRHCTDAQRRGYPEKVHRPVTLQDLASPPEEMF